VITFGRNHRSQSPEYAVLDWFKAQGAGYQTRINAVLRAFVHARQRAEPARQKSERNR
jgi:hypothetical protein